MTIDHTQDPTRTRRASILWLAFLAVSAVHLASHLCPLGDLDLATKPLLMPILLAWFLTVTRRGRLRTLVGIGLGLSWLGDLGLMPSGEAWFLAGLGAFLLAQLTYAVAFWPYRSRSVVTRPLATAPYVLGLVVLLAALWGELGEMRLPVIAYALAIITMAILATGLGSTVAIGAILFVVSDTLIAVDSVTDLYRLPAHGFWVMLTYLLAQALIARGVSGATQARGGHSATDPDRVN